MYDANPRRHRVIALVPARNEQDTIAATVASLMAQTRRPDTVVVVANNCTDDTFGRARSAGATVFDMPDNPHRKAGALNFGLDRLDPQLRDTDVMLVVDADSVLAPDFIEQALPHLARAGAVSGAFEAVRKPGVLAWLQRIEYAQARHRTGQRAGNVNVLSGAAAMFTVGVLRAVRDRRGHTLPGRAGDWYDIWSLVEDYELTMAVKALGVVPVSPPALRVSTDVMVSPRDLWRQRMRWQAGWLADTSRYPWSMTWRPWLTQAWTHVSALAAPLMLMLLVVGVFGGGPLWGSDPVWLAVVPVFVAAEAWTARKAGPVAALLAAAILPMWLYGVWRNAVYYTAVARVVTRPTFTANATWH